MARRTTKTCSKCQESKTRNRFTRDGRTRDGLRKVCEDCRQASRERRTASVGAPAAEETREQQNDAQTAAESFDEIVQGLQDITFTTVVGAWPFYKDDRFSLSSEQMEAASGILIALLRKDGFGAKVLLGEVCHSQEEAMTLSAHIIEILIDYVLTDEQKKLMIKTEGEIIQERLTWKT